MFHYRQRTSINAMLAVAAAIMSPSYATAQESAELALPGPEHDELAALAGEWTLYSATPGDIDEPAEQVIGTATGRTRMEGRFLEIEFTANSGPIPHGVYTFGFDRRHNHYTVIVMDDTGTYFVTAKGEEEDNGRIAMWGEDDEPVMTAMGFDKEFIIALHLKSADRIVIETIFIDTRTEARTEIPTFAFELRR